MTTTKNTETAALQLAFDTYTSSASGLTADEALALSDEDWDEKVSVWHPFEDFDRAYVVAEIESTAEAISQKFTAI